MMKQTTLLHRRGRRLGRTLHLWLGLILAAPFLVTVVSGCLLGLAPELDRALNPRLFHPQPGPASGGASPADADQVLAIARAASPLPVMAVRLPDADSPVWVVSQGNGQGAAMGIQLETFVDPATGAVVGQRSTATGLVRWLHRLHNAFLIDGDWPWPGTSWGGRQWVGIVGLAVAAMILTGAVLLVPPVQGWRRAAFPRRGAVLPRWLLDWHGALSLWLFGLIVLITLTGITMEFPQASRALFGLGGGGHVMAAPVAKPDQPFAISADQALHLARQAMPGKRPMAFNPAGPGNPQWRVSLVGQAGPWRGRTQVTVDAGDGRVHSAATPSLVGLYFAQQHGLHGGAVLGLGGRLVILACGLVQFYLIVSGVVVWLRRQVMRLRQRPFAADPLGAPPPAR